MVLISACMSQVLGSNTGPGVEDIREIEMHSPLELLAFVSAVFNNPKRRDDRGAAITEYVVLIGFVVLAAGILQLAGVWQTLADRIEELIGGV